MEAKQLIDDGWNLNPEDLQRISLNKNISTLEKAITALETILIINGQIKNVSGDVIKQNNETMFQLSKYFADILKILSAPKQEVTKTWKFKIIRDGNNLITEIMATPT